MPTLSLSSSRRTFLRTAGLVAAGAAVLPRPTARAAAPAFATSSDPSTEIIWMSATKLAQLIREKKVSAVEAVDAYIARIEAVNPKLNAVCMPCFERARQEAKSADAALAAGKLLGPLHGVPMTIKDSIDTAGVVSTGGTMGRINFVPEKDATVVARARAAGAILLGKTNTPEFTLSGFPGLTTTWNLIYGTSRNPYNPLHSTAGSSGGAGAIVAAGGAAFDIGSDFGGSIRGPAHANGVAGIKPTSGLVPRTGHIVDYGGIFDAYQQLGPLARKVEDLVLITGLIAGPDGKDAAILPAPLLDPSAVELGKLRVAFYVSNGVSDPTLETKAMVKKAADALGSLGASVNEDIHPHYAEAVELRTKIRNADGNAWLKRVADRCGSKVVAPSLKFTAPEATTPELVAMLEQQDRYRRAMTSWLRNYDVILCPTSAQPAPRIDAGPGGANLSYTQIYNITGWPGVVFRGGSSPDGLPLGLQVVARPFREDVAFAVARHLEGILGGWQKPAI
ncbi:MAG TPA: amidase [Opitutaceae bacterium]